jgi:hypothetical protein
VVKHGAAMLVSTPAVVVQDMDCADRSRDVDVGRCTGRVRRLRHPHRRRGAARDRQRLSAESPGAARALPGPGKAEEPLAWPSTGGPHCASPPAAMTMQAGSLWSRLALCLFLSLSLCLCLSLPLCTQPLSTLPAVGYSACAPAFSTPALTTPPPFGGACKIAERGSEHAEPCVGRCHHEPTAQQLLLHSRVMLGGCPRKPQPA